ncbi:MAG: ABC transporter permease [Burkholderiales bacterium]|nr:ABC transporter permease [Burkholderiales bacterium]
MSASRATRASRILAVVRKELVDSLRDRRTLLVSLVTAAAAGPIFLVLIFNLIASQSDRARELKLPAVGIRNAPALAAFLERNQVTLSEAPDDYEAKLSAGDLDVVLVVDDRFATDVADGRQGTVRVVADRSRDRAQPAIRQVETLLRAYNRQWGGQRLLLRGVSPFVGHPLKVDDVDLATPQQSGAIILFLVAFYGLLASVMGGMAVALDTTAGERERQSLEPLLMTPARPLELVTGKWLAVASFNALVVVVTLAGFYLTLSFAPLPPVGAPFLFSAREFFRFLVVLAPMILLIPAVLLYVGTRGRTFKEAQANVSVLMFVVTMIPAVQLFLQQREPAWLVMVPISGQYMLLKLALRGEAIAPAQLLASYVVPAALVIVALVGVARLLSRESILAGR